MKDPVWGEISLLSWEKVLLNSSVFNRLHNVIQNSNAYRVYPSATHSRFLHSIGVMYAATRIAHSVYRNHLLQPFGEPAQPLENGESGALYSECKLMLDSFVGSVDLEKVKEERRVLNTSGVREIPTLKNKVCTLDGLAKELFAEIQNQGFEWHLHPELYPGLCVVRVASLMHDIGHLPYSHIFEHALEMYLEEGGDAQLLDCFSSEGSLHEKAAHEQLGSWIMDYLAKEADIHTKDCEELVKLVTIAREVLHGSLFPIHKSIVSGVIDADRIDYVRRDCELSGFIRSSVDYDRLFRNFIVGSPRLKSSAECHFVIPSVKATSDLEKVLWERYQEYMYVVGHHRVCLFDEITKRLIYYLLRDGALDAIVSGIKDLYENAHPQPRPATTRESQRQDRIASFLKFQCDDGVVDELFKAILSGPGQINSVSPKSNKSGRKPQNEYEAQLIDSMAIELCERRDYFSSAFKTDDDFWDWMVRVSNSGHRSWSKHPLNVAELATRIRSDYRKIEREIYHDKATKGTVILIGDAYRKIKSGLGDQATIEAYSLVGLNGFLKAKHDQIRAFNLWYALGSGVTKEMLLDSVAENVGIRSGLLPIIESKG